MKYLLAAFALAAATATVYWSGLHGPFLMDDFDALHPLARAQAAGQGWWEVLQGAPNHIRARWLSNLTFLVSHAAGGGTFPPDPYPYKLGNLVLHLLCGAACGVLARALARRWNATPMRATWVALLAGGLFLLHPLLVSTVLYPVQRMAQLSALFSLLAVWAYVEWRQRYDRLTPFRHAAGVAAVLGATGLAVLAKENGALVPLFIGVIELTAFAWPARESARRSRFDTGFGLACAAPLVLGGVLLAVRLPGIAASYSARDFTLVERLLTQLQVLPTYLGQVLWPRIGAMGLYHDDLVPVHSLDAVTLAAGLGLLAALAAALWLRRRAPAFAFGVLWFLAAHALEGSVIPLELYFEHRNYTALLGPALAVAWAITGLRPLPAAALGLALLATLAGQTARRAADWSDYPRWIEAEAAARPRSLRAGTDLFQHLAARGDLPAAVAERERLLRLHPAHAQPVLLKLRFACGGGPIAVQTFDAAELARLKTAAVGKDAFHVYLGIRNAVSERCADPDWNAFALAARQIAENPHQRRIPGARAAWLRLAAPARARSGQWDAVAAALDDVFALRDDDPRDHVLGMRAALELGDGRDYLRRRARLLGLVRGQLGALQEEVDRLDAAARTLPETPPAAAPAAPPVAPPQPTDPPLRLIPGGG
jgi:hypothetical protein